MRKCKSACGNADISTHHVIATIESNATSRTSIARLASRLTNSLQTHATTTQLMSSLRHFPLTRSLSSLSHSSKRFATTRRLSPASSISRSWNVSAHLPRHFSIKAMSSTDATNAPPVDAQTAAKDPVGNASREAAAGEKNSVHNLNRYVSLSCNTFRHANKLHSHIALRWKSCMEWILTSLVWLPITKQRKQEESWSLIALRHGADRAKSLLLSWSSMFVPSLSNPNYSLW